MQVRSWNQKCRRVAAGAVKEKLLLPTSLFLLDGNCTTKLVKNLSSRITKNWL